MSDLLFGLGEVVATPGALELLKNNHRTIIDLLLRHASGDWGELDEHDRQENEFSLKKGLRILSVYQVNGKKMWVITEADRSSTCLLLPEEY